MNMSLPSSYANASVASQLNNAQKEFKTIEQQINKLFLI